MNAHDWHCLLLQDNPFSIHSPESPYDIQWAGMPELKEEIEHKFLEAEQSSATEVILCRGPFGGGKTHAMLYYSLLDNWPVASNPGVRHIFVIPVRLPKEPAQADKDFYIDVLESIGMPQIRRAVAIALQEVGMKAGLAALQKITGSESLGQAIAMLGIDDDFIPNDLFKSHTRSEKEVLLEAYFLEGCTKEDLRKLGLAHNIDKAQDRFRVLAGIVHCFIGLTPANDMTIHNRVCLWVDELEDLIYFTTAQFRPFTQGLCDLIDHLPNFFTMMLNVTFADPSELDTIEVLTGKPLVDRITDHIIFQEMTTDQGIQYIQELMSFWRTKYPKDLELSPLYPFEEEALRTLIADLESKTPRDINQRCTDIITEAFQRGVITTLGSGIIDKDFVRSVESNRLLIERDISI